MSNDTKTHWLKTFWIWFASIVAVGAGIVTILSFAYPGTTNEILSKILTSSQEISDVIKDTKKETSEDPRKELANIGVNWDRGNYREALYGADVKTLDLFIKGGMPFKAEEINLMPTGSLNPWGREEYFDSGTANLLLSYKAELPPRLCKPAFEPEMYQNNEAVGVNYIFFTVLMRDMRKVDFLKQACGVENLKTHIANQIELRNSIEYKSDAFDEHQAQLSEFLRSL